jgi:hypothetical protein
MRRCLFIVALLAFTGLANSALAQDSTRRDTTRQDTTRQDTTHRVNKRVRVTSPGDVDTAKIHAPSRRDSSLVRHEMRRDTASAGSDTAARPPKPPPDSQPPKKP